MNTQQSDSSEARLCDLFPGIERLTLFVAFEEADSGSDPNYQQLIFTEDSIAAFQLDCSRQECRHGGFDYEPFIRRLVDSQEQQLRGEIACQGTLGSLNGSACCALKSDFRIIAQYQR